MSDHAIIVRAKAEVEGFVKRLGGVSILDCHRMALLARKTIDDNPGLAECTPASLRRAFAACAITGLYPDGQEAAIVPFKNKKSGKKEATFVAGYHGLVRLAYEHPDVGQIRAGVAYEGETLEAVEGTAPSLRYVPILDGSISRLQDKIVAAWACANVKGLPVFVVMSIDQVKVIRDRAPGGDGDAWQKNLAPMAAKTATKQLLGKWVPRKRSLSLAIAADNAAEVGIPQVIDAEVEEIIADFPETPIQPDPWEKKPSVSGPVPSSPELPPDDFPFADPPAKGTKGGLV